MKKVLYFSLMMMLVFCVSGCGSEKSKINSDSKLVAAKKTMIENLNNYSYDVKMTAKTGYVDVTANMSCTDDRKNQIGHCSMSTYGVETEEYFDYKNMVVYSKMTTAFGGDSSNGKWISAKYNGGNTNTWLNLNDYVFNIAEESKDGGTYYTGTIDSKKLAAAMSEMNSDVGTSNIVSDDINIRVFVNSSNYIEKMTFTIEIMGIEEMVEINYKEFNTSDDIVIPSEAIKSQS